MLRTMYSGISGLRSHQTALDVVGNNISNVNTTGFKRGRAVFADVMSENLSFSSAPDADRGGVNSRQIGLGSSIIAIDNIHTQGPMQNTNRVNDLAIEGNGFFAVKDGDNTYYTRAGNLDFDGLNYLINSGTGYRVQGWNSQIDPVTREVKINTSEQIDSINFADKEKLPAKATNLIEYACNLDAAAEERNLPARATMNYTDDAGNKQEFHVNFIKIDQSTYLWIAEDDTEGQVGTGTVSLDRYGNIADVTGGQNGVVQFDPDGVNGVEASASLQPNNTAGFSAPDLASPDVQNGNFSVSVREVEATESMLESSRGDINRGTRLDTLGNAALSSSTQYMMRTHNLSTYGLDVSSGDLNLNISVDGGAPLAVNIAQGSINTVGELVDEINAAAGGNDVFAKIVQGRIRLFSLNGNIANGSTVELSDGLVTAAGSVVQELFGGPSGGTVISTANYFDTSEFAVVVDGQNFSLHVADTVNTVGGLIDALNHQLGSDIEAKLYLGKLQLIRRIGGPEFTIDLSDNGGPGVAHTGALNIANALFSEADFTSAPNNPPDMDTEYEVSVGEPFRYDANVTFTGEQGATETFTYRDFSDGTLVGVYPPDYGDEILAAGGDLDEQNKVALRGQPIQLAGSDIGQLAVNAPNLKAGTAVISTESASNAGMVRIALPGIGDELVKFRTVLGASSNTTLEVQQEKGALHSTSVTIFDSKGKAYNLNLEFEKIGVNTWEYSFQLDKNSELMKKYFEENPPAGTEPSEEELNRAWDTLLTDADINPDDPKSSRHGVVVFDDFGRVDHDKTRETNGTIGSDLFMPVSFQPTEAERLWIDPDIAGASQFDSPSTTSARFQNGYDLGILRTYEIDNAGKIIGSYSNDQKAVLAQISIASFVNPGGMSKAHSNLWEPTANSGIPVIGVAGTGQLGVIRSGMQEMSNVDLAQEFTDMIVIQRGFQANARSITTGDQILQELIGLKR